MTGYGDSGGNVFRFPERDTDGITIEQVRRILLASRESMDRHMGVLGQEDELRSWAESRGFKVVDHVLEVRSGRLVLEDRPVMQTVLKRIEHGETDAIVWATFARVARSEKQTERIFYTCWEAGVRTYVLRGKDESEPYGEVRKDHPEEFWRRYAREAEAEGRLFQERMTAGKRAKAARGAYPISGCTPPPFEMDRIQQTDPWTGETRTVQIPNRERWEMKEQMLEARAKGIGYKLMAKQLNAAGSRQRHGALWNREAIRKIVHKPFPLIEGLPSARYERAGTPRAEERPAKTVRQRSA